MQLLLKVKKVRGGDVYMRNMWTQFNLSTNRGTTFLSCVVFRLISPTFYLPPIIIDVLSITISARGKDTV